MKCRFCITINEMVSTGAFSQERKDFQVCNLTNGGWKSVGSKTKCDGTKGKKNCPFWN